ncbi:methyltransferase domain-containing protein [Kordiimonas sp. SCSIO 12610]|uniref:methyltransferase domain-containing protein n=1 Tax=Kordiimonas sp. SCSIO 12610 TaxID=2829597 RepID=UPI00210B7289|nr:methyltransferase domain-containing protein [Kordiimonas sp. SCSIO 12610]UTW55737.1 methyltransferase domain-containing protein [Kordiimonas sp. SCSIO 12610]
MTQNTQNSDNITLFDQEQVLKNAIRSQRLPDDHNFLHREIADRMNDRLLDINRKFQTICDLGGLSNIAALSAASGVTNIREFPCEFLDIEPNHFDLIVSNLRMHWINDLPGLLIQTNRALKPDGLFMASIFGGDTLFELRHALITAESEITSGAHSRISPFADVRDIGSILQRAGFALPVTDMDTITVTYEHPLKLMQDLRGMGETNALINRSKNFMRKDVLMRASEIYLRDFAGSDGRIPATFQIIYMTGWHPHESQQKPLKPGSGKINLRDALGKKPNE